jgi:hypothetical protein
MVCIRPNPESLRNCECLHGPRLQAGKTYWREVVNLGEEI